MTSDALQRRLRAIADYQAADFGFTPDCEAHVYGFITTGVQRITNDGYLDHPERIVLAEAGITRLIAEMIIEARSRGYTELHEDTFWDTIRSICPIWPFC